ncbi:excisionase family DNA-binding protein [Duganella sp. S19_KUP01_CR8]|uniref:excisionase family DNA-binding protein n=1 Tax=Duganella sp. S19_KUP01_CR8 TaxID=3025502 RepID=UPI003FA5263F
MPNDCLTLAEAAELLNVSRPYILRLVEEGTVSLARSDLTRYKDEHTKATQKALQLLADQAQELDMGY